MSPLKSDPKAMLVVCMGVSGTGKTSLAQHLARRLDWTFIEADDFHPSDNRLAMEGGQPLNDQQRAPWMAAIVKRLEQASQLNESCFLSHSALRRAHRQQLRDCGLNTLFLHLHAEQALIGQRMAHRKDHFMPPALLQSQFDDLQAPIDEPDVLPLDVSGSLASVELLALQQLSPWLTSAPEARIHERSVQQ